MRIRKHSRIVALALALVMILPLISIPAFAEDTVEPLNVFKNFDTGNIGDALSKWPTLAKLENGALRLDYAAYSDGKYWAKTGQNNSTEITDFTVDEETNTLTGKVTIGGVVYNIAGPINTTRGSGTAATSVTKAEDGSAYTGDALTIYTTAANDAWRGGWNVAAVTNVKVPAVTADTYNKIYVSADYYFSEDVNNGASFEVTWATMAKADGGNTRLDLANIKATDTYMQLDAHGNQTSILAGESTTIAPKGTWMTIAITIDMVEGTAMLQLNGDYVRTITDVDISKGLVGNGFNVLQISRGTTQNPDQMKGYVLVDNVSITSVAPDVIYSNDFEQYAGIADLRSGIYKTNFANTLPSKVKVMDEEDNSYLNFGFGADPILGGEYDTPLFAYTDGYAKWGQNAALKAAGDSAYNRGTGILTVNDQEYTVDTTNANPSIGYYGTFSDGSTTWKLSTGGYACEARWGDNNVDRPVTLKLPPISSKDYGAVYLSADFYIAPGSVGNSYIQFQKVVGAERNIAHINLASGHTGKGGAYLVIGQWTTLTIKLDMVNATATYYINGAQRHSEDAAWLKDCVLSQDADNPTVSSKLHIMKHDKVAGSTGSIALDNVKVTASMPEFDYLAYQDFESYELGTQPSTAFASIANSGTTVSDAKGSKAWKVDFDNTVSSPVNINKNPTIVLAASDSEATPSIVYEADYFIEAGSKGQLQVQMNPMKYNGTGRYWADLYMLYFRDGGTTGLLTDEGNNGSMSFPIGEWITVSAVINMKTAAVSIYLDGAFAFSYNWATKAGKTYAAPLSFDACNLIMGKVNNGKTTDKGTFYMDNIAVFEGSRPTKMVQVETILNQDFESFAVGEAPTAAFSKIAHSNTTVSDAKGSKAWKIDYLNVGSHNVDDGDVNIDKNPYIKAYGTDFISTPSVVLEMKYFIEEGSIGAFQTQLYPLVYNEGAGSKNWCDLYQIRFNSDSTAAYVTVENGSTEGKPTMGIGRWNTVSAVIDLEDGDTAIYVNGVYGFGYNLSERYGLKNSDGSPATNYSFASNKWIIGKVNKVLGQGTLYIDDVKIYAGTAPADAAVDRITYEEFIDVKDGDSTARAGFESVPTLLTFKKEANGNTALRLDMGASASPDVWWAVRSDANYVHRNVTRETIEEDWDEDGVIDNSYPVVYIDDDEYEVQRDETTKDQGDIDDWVGVEYIEIPDEEDDTKIHRFWILPGNIGEAAYGGENAAATNACVCDATKLSHSDAKTAILETDLFIEEGSTGIVESQFTGYTYDGLNENEEPAELSGGWLQIFHLHMESGIVTGQGGTNYGVRVKVGEWNNFKVLVDLETGIFKVYVNGVLARVYDCGRDNITITAPWSVVKVQRHNSPVAPYEGGILIDNVLVSTKNVPTSTFEAAPNWFLSEEAFNWYTEDLITQVEGASIRLSGKTGLRFASIVNTQKLDYLKTAFGAENIAQGTLITPEDYLTAAGEASREALDQLKETYTHLKQGYIDVKFDGSYFSGDNSVDVGDDAYMVGSIVNILPQNITREFAGFGYIEIKGIASFYGEACVRSVQNVAIAARAAHDATDGGIYNVAQLAIIDAYAAGNQPGSNS